MIDVKDRVKDYGSFRAVDGVSFSVASGEIVGLLGPNGAGKTTIMKVLTGYHYQSAGSAILNGVDVSQAPILAKRSVGYLPETAPLYTDMTVYEYLDFIAKSRGLQGSEKNEAITKTVNDCGLQDVVNKTIDTLSKGYRQRVGLAQAIIHSPEILILDEPTTGLDPNQIIEIRSLIKKIGKQKTVILSTHIMQEVEAVCDRVIIINNGKIAAEGTTSQISKELSGTTNVIDVTFKNSKEVFTQSSINDICSKLSNYCKAKEILVTNSGDNLLSLSLKIDNNENGAETVFDFAIENGIKIVSLASKQLNLEEIFIKLTSIDGEEASKLGGDK